jgi:hypothetical protein
MDFSRLATATFSVILLIILVSNVIATVPRRPWTTGNYYVKTNEIIINKSNHYYVYHYILGRNERVEVSRSRYMVIGLSSALFLLILPTAFVVGSLYYMWFGDVPIPNLTAKKRLSSSQVQGGGSAGSKE